MKPKTSNERVTKHRADAKGKGWKRKEFEVTDAEHLELKQKLKDIRSTEG